MNRGEIYWVDFGEPKGSGPAFKRPALVVQCDSANRSNLATIIVLAVTSAIRYRLHPNCVFVSSLESGLDRDSVVNCSQIMTIDKDCLEERAGELPGNLMMVVDEKLRVVLDL